VGTERDDPGTTLGALDLAVDREPRRLLDVVEDDRDGRQRPRNSGESCSGARVLMFTSMTLAVSVTASAIRSL